MIRLFINGNQIELFQSERIGYTKQVNDLKDLASRQTNYSQIFKVPGTAKNITFFKGLGLIGSTSMEPYKKNEVRLFIGNTCLIFNGSAVFQEHSKGYYEINIYDGNIDFFKLLDNVKFEDINFSELDHVKDVTTIIDNWENGNDYFKYLLADYNGKTHFLSGSTKYINTDYLIPSVPIKFLWDRMFETFGFSYSGSIFEDAEFLNTYLTFPKGVVSGAVGDEVFSLSFPSQKMISFAWGIDPLGWLLQDYFNYDNTITSGQIIPSNYNAGYKLYEIPEEGYYNIEITGSFQPRAKVGVSSQFYLGFDLQNSSEQDVRSMMSNGSPNLVLVANETGDISYNKNVSLRAGQTITFLYGKDSDVDNDDTTLDFSFTLSKIEQTSIDQFQFFKGLTPKDFYKEIMWRFGLTPYPSKDINHIEFLTYAERIDKNDPQDWSDRFLSKESEKYVFDGYAKNNYYRFKYNGEEDDFNDGVLIIRNENLDDQTDVIKSKTYSVEEFPEPFEINGIQFKVPRMELWKKEVKDVDGATAIEYKPRDARFSFLQEKVINESVNVGSEQLGEFGQALQLRSAANISYSAQSIIEKRYASIRSLFTNTKIITAKFQMTASEFDSFDLKEPISVKQLGGNFIVNKLSKSDLGNKETQAELIKINK